MGKRTIQYSAWRDEIAIPFLDENFGHECASCGAEEDLAVDHILNRGSRPDLKMDLTNVQWLCPICHSKKTDRIS